MSAKNSHPNAERFTFLKDLKLAVHSKETKEDQEAVKIIRELIGELCPDAKLKIIKTPYESEDWPLPWLNASYSVFYGLDQIKAMADEERQAGAISRKARAA
jgi:hypothetical protein